MEIWGAGDAKTLEQQRVLMKQQEQVHPFDTRSSTLQWRMTTLHVELATSTPIAAARWRLPLCNIQLRQERRQVDKGRLVDSNFDREFLLGGTFSRAKGPDAPAV